MTDNGAPSTVGLQTSHLREVAKESESKESMSSPVAKGRGSRPAHSHNAAAASSSSIVDDVIATKPDDISSTAKTVFGASDRSEKAKLPRTGKGGHSKGPKKPALTHFLCVPLVNDSSRPTLSSALERFKNEICCSTSENAESPSQTTEVVFPVKAIRPIGTLHLTLGVMSLEDEERVQKAVSFLENLDLDALLLNAVTKDEVNGSGSHTGNPVTPLGQPTLAPVEGATVSAFPSIRLHSLSAMRNPRDTTVLYAIPSTTSPSFPLYEFCKNLRSVFTEARLMMAEERPLKLHATVVNTIYAKSGARSAYHSSKHAKDRGLLKFDARPLIEKYKDFVWADKIMLGKVAICKMGAKKMLDDKGEIVNEEYEEVAWKTMPSI